MDISGYANKKQVSLEYTGNSKMLYQSPNIDNERNPVASLRKNQVNHTSDAKRAHHHILHLTLS